MSLDLNELKTSLELLMPEDLRPLPYWAHVIGWVKAFYQPTEQDLITWVVQHQQVVYRCFSHAYTCYLCDELIHHGIGRSTPYLSV